MTKINLGELSGKIYGMLNELEKEDREKVLYSVCILLDSAQPSFNTTGKGPQSGSSNENVFQTVSNNTGAGNAGHFFDQKSPTNKGEQYAVAARFREIKNLGDTHTKEDFKAVFKEARKHFDEKNFKRDTDNARNQAKFFIKGDEKGSMVLSSYGQKYVDALPNRGELSNLKKDGKASKGKKKKAAKAV